MSKVMEIVSFKLNEGASDTAFLEANEKLNSWVQLQPGFESRKLLKQKDDSWMDVIQWATLEQAQKAGEKIMSELADSQCMTMINPESVVMNHHELKIQLAAVE